MIIRFSLISSFAPQAQLSISGDVLTYNGNEIDFTDLAEDDVWEPLPGSPILAPVRRIGGVPHVVVLAHLGLDAAPVQPTAADHWVVDVTAGPVEIPYVRIGA